MSDTIRPTVVKVGGSLFDLPKLGQRLRAWLDQLDTRRVLLVPGGGPAADAVRLFDRVQDIGEEAAHWCAVRAMSLNAAMLVSVLLHPVLVDDLSVARLMWQAGERFLLLDPFHFFQKDDKRTGRFPTAWDVTSDSLAVRAAIVFNARRLILLKSVTIPLNMGWAEASQRGYVDRYFPTALAGAGDLVVQAVNFRPWQPPS
jgi:aspartokinase-like uncharacterized kinase